MSDDIAIQILVEVRLLRWDFDRLLVRLTNGSAPDAIRIEPYKVQEFARLVRRSRMWVSERCRTGVIKTLPGKPYRIPVSELKRWTEVSR